MDKIAEIKKLLKEFGSKPNLPIAGTVKTISGETCSVEIIGGLVLSDIRLNATVTDQDDFLLMTPVIGSKVLMLSNDGSLRNLVVIKMDQVEKFKFYRSGLVIEFDGTDKKVAIHNEFTSLHDILSEAKSVLQEFKVLTPDGPSTGLTPETIAALGDFETLFKKLFK